MSPEIISIFILVSLSAFFSSAETALVSINKQQLHNFKKEKRRGFRSLLALYKRPSLMITTILIGNNIVNIAATSLSTQLFIGILAEHQIINKAYITIITTIIVAIFLLVFGEVTPKNMALARSKKTALFSAPIIRFLSIILSPLVYLLSGLSSLLIKLTGGHQLERGTLVTEEEILNLIEAGRDSGAIEQDEEKMLSEVIKFGDKIIHNVMTPMENVTALEEHASLQDINNVIREKPRSRLPVYRQQRTNVIGILYLKDLLFHIADQHIRENKLTDFDLTEHKELVRKPFFVQAEQKTTDILKQMKAQKVHIAIVKNRQQQTVGIVTIEDLIEEIIGEIQDEHEK